MPSCGASTKSCSISNEEVQSATEEVETLNEELQATNEELETLNEELQATVEELNTTNDDLQARSIELQELAISLEMQQRLSELERDRIQVVLDNLGNAVLVVDAQGAPLLSNDAFQEMFGAAGESFRPEDPSGNVLTEDLRLQDRVAAGEAFTTEFLLTASDGSRHWYEAFARPIEDAIGDRMGVIVVRDVTDRSLRSLQDEFLALASHELRTPLTSLAGSLQLLQRRLGDGIDERSRQQLDVARLQTRQLTALIYDLIDIVRLQTGRLHLNTESIDIVSVVRDAVESSRDATKGQTIEIDAPAHPLIVSADRTRLTQVLTNLIDNAITYAPGTERIDIEMRKVGSQAEIRVRDYGPGIPEDERERIFARFSQLELARSERQNSDGLGLGLYIAREIVTAHNGTLTLDDEVETGSAFVVRLPIAES